MMLCKGKYDIKEVEEMPIVYPDYEKVEERKKELRELQLNWRRNMSEDEDRLYDLISEYEEEYFEDFTFRPGSIVTPFIEGQVEYDNELVTEYEEVPVEMHSLSMSHYRLRVEDLVDSEGQTNPIDRIIIIPPRNLDNKKVILHDMIHAFEEVLSDFYWTYKEILITRLYKELTKKIADLDDRLVMHCHTYISWRTLILGGEHDILFFLRALTLIYVAAISWVRYAATGVMRIHLSDSCQSARKAVKSDLGRRYYRYPWLC